MVAPLRYLAGALITALLSGSSPAAGEDVPPPIHPAQWRGLPASSGTRDGTRMMKYAVSDPDTFRVAAILVEFPEDNDPTTTGNGRLGDVLDANEYVFGDSIFPELFDIPHDLDYFNEQLEYLAQYYRTVSRGRLEIVHTLVDSIFTAPDSMGFYGDNEDAGVWQSALLRDAVSMADPLVDFAEMDGIVVFHAGVGEETDLNDDSPGDIWTTYLTIDDLAEAFADSGMEDAYRGIPTGDITAGGDTFFISRGAIFPESETQDNFPQWLLGVAAHMMGRMLGAPSLFDTDSNDGSSSQGIGNFGIMGTGLYNSGGILPPHPCAWVKTLFGWIDPLVVTRDTTIQLPLVEKTGSEPAILKIPISETEYFLIENRYKDENGDGLFTFDDVNGDNVLFPFEDSYEGAEFDWSIPEEGKLNGSGLFIWHIDEAKIAESGDFQTVNRVNADADRKGIDLEEADAIQDLDTSPTTYDNFGSPYDSWRVGNAALFGPESEPGTESNFDAWTGITIEAGSEAESVMTVSIRFRETPDGWPLRAPGGIRITGPVVPVKSLVEDLAGFAYAYFDSADGKCYGNWIGPGGEPLSGWPVELPGEASFGPVAFPPAADGPVALHFPLADGSVSRIGSDGSLLMSADWSDAMEGAEGHYLSVLLPTGPVVSLIPTAGGTVVRTFDTSGAELEEDVLLEGRATGPATHGWSTCMATDAGKVYSVKNGSILDVFDVEGIPSPPVTVRYVDLEGGALPDAAAPIDLVTASGNKLHIFQKFGTSDERTVVELSGTITGQPALADIDMDGISEIIVGTEDGTIHLINRTGAPSTDWPLHIRSGLDSEPYDPPVGSPAVGDFDGDGEPEIAFCTAHGALHIVDRHGSHLNGYPVSVEGSSPWGVSIGKTLSGESTFVFIATETGGMNLDLRPAEDALILWAGYANGNGFRGHHWESPYLPPEGVSLLVDEETFVYPNPAGRSGEAIIHYRLTRPGTISIRIYDITGNIMKEFEERSVPAETGEQVWGVTDVSSGIYFARVEAKSGGAVDRKFITIAVQK